MNQQNPLPELLFSDELAFLQAWDRGPRPPGWRLTPQAVVTFLCGSNGRRLQADGEAREVQEKFVGERSLVERCVVTLAGDRGLLLVGEPGTAKSMLSELLAAAISGVSTRVVQGTAGTTEEHFRYGWNYPVLLASGPVPHAVVPSPVLEAMQTGSVVRIEEVTRCLAEVQDALVSLLSDRRMAIPELGASGMSFATPGFCVIATANLRDRGVSEMSAALKRRFNFETVPPIAAFEREVALVEREAQRALASAGVAPVIDRRLLDALITTFRDLRLGQSAEGWAIERPTTVMSTSEAVAVATSLGLQATYFGVPPDRAWRLLPGYLLGVVQKDEPKDYRCLLAYWDGAVKRRAVHDPFWAALYDARSSLESAPVPVRE